MIEFRNCTLTIHHIGTGGQIDVPTHPHTLDGLIAIRQSYPAIYDDKAGYYYAGQPDNIHHGHPMIWDEKECCWKAEENAIWLNKQDGKAYVFKDGKWE